MATWLSVYRFPPSRISDGSWKTNLLAGSARSGPYRRAAVAIHGLFALNRSESAYYTAMLSLENPEIANSRSWLLNSNSYLPSVQIALAESSALRFLLSFWLWYSADKDRRGSNG